MPTVEVSLPVPLDKTFTYQIPENIKFFKGAHVLVPFGSKKKVGVVLSHSDKPQNTSFKLKPIDKILDDEPVVPASYLEWLTWAASYYMAPLGEVFAAAFPSPFFDSKEVDKIFKKKTRVSPIDGHWVHEKEVQLSEAQEKILQELTRIPEGKFEAALLHGITGSGKTEIYIRFMQHLLERGQSVIYLVPEIGLTPQVIARLSHAFGDKLAVTHSALTENQRLNEWLRAKRGEARVMVGTRSALFAPFSNCGAIIIDEEHDASYKQEERFRYHARDLALVRGKQEGFAVLMGSATPSLETYQNAMSGKYRFYELKERATKAVLPSVTVVDIAKEKRQTHSPLILSQSLIAAIEKNLKSGEQTMLLMNRRGFARSFFCLACEKALECPNCSVNLIHHRGGKSGGGELVCHYCDYVIPLPQSCTYCGGKEVTLLGSGTQTLEEELTTYFPKARVARLDRDVIRKKGVLLETLKDLRDGKINILVGTQMIAKGHDIENVTLVGVVGIDNGLGIPDFRASERTFQLITQVAGRAGRGNKAGRVFIQTYSPNHAAIRLACAHDYRGFYEEEMKWRKELHYPPYARLVQIRWSSPNEKKIEKFMSQGMTAYLKKLTSIEVLGPAPSVIEKVRGEYRWHVMLKGESPSALREAARGILMYNEKSGENVRCIVDIDPLGML